jgi:hypothetical protein
LFVASAVLFVVFLLVCFCGRGEGQRCGLEQFTVVSFIFAGTNFRAEASDDFCTGIKLNSLIILCIFLII